MSDFIPELLAPAGNPACAVAAINAGADAVYAGIDKFNARARGENFSTDDMARLAVFLHRRKKKLYLTANTILKESELEDAAGLLAFANNIGVDALIVQDLGLAHMAREFFPDLKLHASTQMAIHNAAGIRSAAKLGFSRVILERQLDIAEMQLAAADSPLELEVFVHGALCCSLSGACYFSSWLGGASGNRGLCKQPCRRRYFSRTGNGFFFSTRDLCAAGNMLEDIIKIPNVVSLKIEGRLRRSDYVRDTVAAYRGLLDRSIDRGSARKLLAGAGGRKWSSGFWTEESRKTLIQHNSLGASGQLAGRVLQAEEGTFTFVPTHPVALGDRMRVQGDDGGDAPAFNVLKMLADGVPARRAKPGCKCTISAPVPVRPGSLVFRLGGAVNIDMKEFEAVPLPGRKIDLDITFDSAGISVAMPALPAAEIFKGEWSLEKARSGGDDSAVEAVLQRFSEEFPRFRPGTVKVTAAEKGLYIPPSLLRRIRREFAAFAEKYAAEDAAAADPALEALLRELAARKSDSVLPAGKRETETVAIRPRGDEPGNPGARRAVSILDFNSTTDECILPDFCSPAQEAGMRKRIKAALDAGIRRFRITNTGGFDFFENIDGVELVTGNPLPVANSMAVRALAGLGAVQIQASWELERSAMEALRDASPLPVEIYRFGRPALLTTRAAIPAADGETVKDGRGIEFSVRTEKRSGLTRIYALKTVSVPFLPGTRSFYDLTNASWREKNLSTFNFDVELI